MDDAGLDALLAFFTSAERFIGLLDGDGLELSPSIGGYARQTIAPDDWTISQAGGARQLTGPSMRFTGFTGTVTGYFLAETLEGATLFPTPFADGVARPLIAVEDALLITPSIILRRGVNDAE